ncbi:MAG: PKD domain-containing protein [Breznakibacter sp.]
MSKYLPRLSRKVIYFLFFVIGLNANEKMHAQKTDLVVNGGILSIRDTKTGITVNGSMIVNNGEVLNNGNLYVADSIVNNTSNLFYKTSNPYVTGGDGEESAGTSAGTVIFMGDKVQHVKSARANTIFFHSIDVQNPQGLELMDSVYALGTVNPTLGSLFLNGNNLYLYYDHPQFFKYDGNLGLEKDGYRIWDTTKLDYGPLNKRSGHVVAKFPNAGSFLPRNLGFNVSSFSIDTPFVVERGHLPLAYAGDGSIRKYFAIRTGDHQNRSVEISYLDSSDYEMLGIQEPDLRIFLNKQNSPINYSPVSGNVDIAADKVTGTVKFEKDSLQILTAADYRCENPPEATLKAKENVCQGEGFEVSIDKVSGLASQAFYFRWFKNNIPLNDTARKISDTLNVLTPIEYKVMVYDNRGCFSYDSLTVTGHPFPKAGFKIDDKNIGYCLGSASMFTDTSTISGTAALTRRWFLNDGTTDTAKVVTHTYASAGNYAVSMVSTSQYGCSDTANRTLAVHPLPDVYFLSQNKCGSSSLCAEFSNMTTFSDPLYAVKTATWAFGADDTVRVSANHQAPVTHCFGSTGLKTVQLFVESNAGCKESFTDTVRIVQQTVNFSAPDVCLGSKTVFTNTSVAQAAGPSYRWDFGDGSSGTVVSPQKVYAKPGLYEVTLHMQTGTCIDSLTREIRVFELPNAGFSSSNTCIGSAVPFSPDDKTQNTYNWTIAGSNATDVSPVRTFGNAGTYNVSLTVTSGLGCVATSSGTFDVYPLPKAGFTFQDVCLGSPVQFYNQSSVSGGSLAYLWSFEDDDPTTAINPSFTFDMPAGSKKVKLIATSNHGCGDTITKTVQVFPLPSAGLPSAISYCADKYTLDATVSDPAMAASYLWNNGSKQARLTVERDGTYSVDITSDKGCRVKESTTVTLNAQTDPHLPDNVTYCTQGILDALYADAYCTWYKDGIGIAGGRYLSVSENGLYKVVVDDGKCSASDSVTVTINPVPAVFLGNDVTECTGTAVTLDAGAGFSSYQWSTGETSRTITVGTSSKYKVTVTNAYGCSNADTVNVSYLPVPQKTLPDVIAQCNFATLDAGDAASYLWSTEATGSSIVVDTSGTYWVKISNGYRCFTHDTVDVAILHADKVDLGDDISVCEGSKVILDAGIHDASYAYTWNRQPSSSSTLQVSKGGRYVAELLNTANGCSSRDTVFVEFKSAPQVSLGNDKALCNALSVVLDAGNPGSLYQWGSSNGAEGIQQAFEVKEPGKYWVTVMNPGGCIASDTIEVYPSSASLVAGYIVASRVFTGDTINFYDLSYPEPYTSLWDFGDGVQSARTSPSHVYYTSETFHVTLTVSNNYCTSSITKAVSVAPSLKKKSVNDGGINSRFIEILSSALYPNPTSGAFTFEMTLSDYGNVLIAVYDLRGILILMERADNLSEFSKQYDLHRLKPGIYIFKASVGKRAVTYKIIKH